MVSIVIPAWNASATIDEALASVLAQTSPDWEAIVVDDGSTDDTRARALAWSTRDARVRVVHQANGGEAAARNHGIAESTGEWLLCLDADDWIAPQHLELMTARLASTGADAVHCGYARVTAAGETVPESYRPPEGDLFPVLARRAAFAVHACVVRRRLVDEVGRFDPVFKTSPDWDLWQRVARTGARFAAVPEVLAFYRMTPGSASRDAVQLCRDGLAVIDNGHRADPRVPTPSPDHAAGVPDAPVTQAYYLLSWCAGLMIGAGQDPRPLFALGPGDRFPELYAPAVAQCLFDAVPQATCDGPGAWERLYPALAAPIERFLTELETMSGATGLAAAATRALRRLVLERSPAWPLIAAELHDQRVEAVADAVRPHDEWRRWAEVRAAELTRERDDSRREADARQALLNAAAAARATLEAQLDQRSLELVALARELEERTREREALSRSGEYEFGNAVLNRWRLRPVVDAAVAARARIVQSATMAQLWLDGRRPRGGRLRVLATACDVFPIYSQTFVYQELTSLAAETADVRFVYSKLDSRDRLGTSFGWLWHAKRRMPLHRPRHERDFAHYRARYPAKVDAIVAALSAASGLSAEAVQTHDNVLQAFTFTRMVERYRPDYLHSYFFYDRTLMTYVAATLLGLPRGVSCYADHRLRDYELKVVPLHLTTCDIVIATSRRIRDELLALAPAMDPARILVKPNGIDTTCFPARERHWPGPGEVLRLVTVCRIEPKKGLLDLVDAVQLLRERGVRVEAHIVGDVDEWSAASRDYKRALDRRITDHGLWGAVHLEGRHTQEGVRRFLDLGHVFVAPFVETEYGDSDGIPTALLEAMAAGLPIVATDAGSIGEAVGSSREALVVKQRTPAALADAIRWLGDRPHAALALGSAAHAAAARFDVSSGERALHERVREVVTRAQTAPA
jgi:glycosyltransferase involved in cell wall biosynthesis